MIRILKFLFKIILLITLVSFKHGSFDDLEIPHFLLNPFFKSILQFVIFWLSLNIIIRFLQLIYRKRKKYGDKYSDNVIVGLHNIYYMIGTIAIIILLLSFFGIEPKELITSISIIAASIAIVLKEILLDIICGIQLSFSKELAIGDYVKIGNQKGTVADINISKIILQNENDDIIYIPNSKAYSTELVNYTQKEIRRYHVEFSINAKKKISLEEIYEIMQLILKDYQDTLDPQEERLKIIEISNEEIRYKMQFKLNQLNPKLASEIKYKLMNAVLQKIQKTEVEKIH